MSSAQTARAYPFRDPTGLALEPEYAVLRERAPVSRASLPYGGEAWLVVRHEDVRLVLSDPRFSRAALLGRDVPRTSPRRLTGPPADLVAGLAMPLPIAVICHMLGVPEADRDRFTEWIDVALTTTA